MGFSPVGENPIGKNRKAGEIPARARHCNWGALQHGIHPVIILWTGYLSRGICQSLSRIIGAGRRCRV